MTENLDSLTLEEMILRLREVSDISWGRYAFSHDFLREKVPIAKQDEMTQKAVACGEEWAKKMMESTGASNPEAMAEAFALVISENNLDMKGFPRPLFAQFIPDNKINLMLQPIDLYAELYLYSENNIHLPTPEKVRSLLLAHEIYHHVEELHEKEIYSRTEKIRLWEVLFVKWDSTVRAVGEIAAMSFSKTLNNIDYSPFFLDMLLLFSYNEKSAKRIFKHIMDIHECR